MHHADPMGLIHSRKSGVMHECSPGKFLIRAALMYHGAQEHNTLKHYGALKGLKGDTLHFQVTPYIIMP